MTLVPTRSTLTTIVVSDEDEESEYRDLNNWERVFRSVCVCVERRKELSGKF